MSWETDCEAAWKRIEELERALVDIRNMTEEIANSKYAEMAGGDTLGAEINRIAVKALSA